MCSSVNPHVSNSRPDGAFYIIHFTLCVFYIIFGYIRVIYSVIMLNEFDTPAEKQPPGCL